MAETVMVVDDEEKIRHLLGEMLRLYGYDVSEAADGLDALHQIENSQPDALILDIMMPNMDGLTLCQILRNRPATADLPIIIISGKAQKKDIAEGLQAGADRYLAKPVAFDVLMSSVRELLDRQ